MKYEYKKYIMEHKRTLISSTILIILPILAYYINFVDNIYIVLSIFMTSMLAYVTYQFSKDNQNIKEGPLSIELMIAFAWNGFICICFGWWYLMPLWWYTAATYYGIRYIQKNEIKKEKEK